LTKIVAKNRASSTAASSSSIMVNVMMFLALLLSQLATTIFGETITGIIYCDNYFEFYFNGRLIAKDPLSFTPHNAVAVSFEYDGVSPKHYAIM
jgi:hypothetical protein